MDPTASGARAVRDIVVVRPASSSLPLPVRRAGGAALGLVSLAVADPEGRLPWALDAVIGAGAVGVEAGARAAGLLGRVAAPVVGVALRPPLLPERYAPATALHRLAARGRAERGAGERELAVVLDAVVPVVVDTALDRLDLTTTVVARVDLGTVVAAALDELDLTTIVTSRVALERVVLAALDTLDLTDVVLTRVDLARIVGAALEELDLTQIVLDGVDLGVVVDAALDRLDLNAVVRERVDLPGIAEEVIDEIDLPEIIRESTGGVTTEAVRGVRMQSIDADERLNRIVDRVLLRRRARRTDAPGDPESLVAEEGEQG